MRLFVIAALMGIPLVTAYAETPEEHVEAPPVEAPTPIELAPAVEILTLSQAQEMALRANPSLASVALRVEQAHQRTVQARSAYFPQASVNYRASRTELPDGDVEALRSQAWSAVGPNAARASFQSFGNSTILTGLTTAYTLSQGIRTALNVPTEIESYELSLELGMLLFDGFAREYTLRAAKIGARETEAAERDAQRLLLFAVAQTYYSIQLAKENIAIATADAAFNKRLLDEAKIGKDAGVASLSDVLNFEIRMRAAEANLIAAERGMKEARIALAALLGMESASLPDAVDIAPLPEESPADLELPEADTIIAAALEHRPDLERSRLAVDRSAAFVGQARAAFLPQVGAFASRSASLQDSSGFEDDDFATTVGVNASIDLFTGGRHFSQHKEARLAKKQAERDLEQAELDALAEVRRSWVNLEEAQQQLVLQRTTAALVQRNRDLVEKEYDAGQAALVRLNEAQRDLIAAQSRLALARVGLFLAHYEMRAATGENLLDVIPAG